MTTPPGFQPAPLTGTAPATLQAAAPATLTRRIAEVVNTILGGKMNVVLKVTLAANATTTTIIDARISYYSALLFSPLTAHAAAAIGGLYVSAQQNGQATLTHASDSNEDKTFNMAILG